MQLESFPKKFAHGTATLEDMLRSLKSIPPELRLQLAKRPECTLFQPDEYDATVALFELVLRGPRTPAESQQLAQLRVIVHKVFNYDLETHLSQLASAMFNIENHAKGTITLRPESLKIHDHYFRGSLRFTRSSDELSPVWAERMQIAASNSTDHFPRLLKTGFRNKPDLRWQQILRDLKLDDLRLCLLHRWSELHPNCEPRVGLCDFTYSAIGQVCEFLFDPKNERDDLPFDKDKVRDAVRRLKLVRRRPTTITGFAIDHKTQWLLLTLANGETVTLCNS